MLDEGAALRLWPPRGPWAPLPLGLPVSGQTGLVWPRGEQELAVVPFEGQEEVVGRGHVVAGAGEVLFLIG